MEVITMEKKKMKVHDALFIIAMYLSDADEEYQPLSSTEQEAWKRIKEVVKNSYEYDEERN